MTRQEFMREVARIRANQAESSRRCAERICAVQGGSIEQRVAQFETARTAGK